MITDRMVAGRSQAPPRFTTFLVKVASRCNIACDYCYIYEHNDQSWRDQPRLMSVETEDRMVERLGEYVDAQGLKRILVVFHGGEPLLAGTDRLALLAGKIRDRAPGVEVDFSVQTNGVLLDERSRCAPGRWDRCFAVP